MSRVANTGTVATCPFHSISFCKNFYTFESRTPSTPKRHVRMACFRQGQAFLIVRTVAILDAILMRCWETRKTHSAEKFASDKR
jgi:hypothetical protein